MRKAVLIVLALLAIRLLPRALRAEARVIAQFTALMSAIAAATANTSKTTALEQRVNQLVTTGIPQQIAAYLAGNPVLGNLTCSSIQCNGNAHVSGSLFGAGGVLNVGDATSFNGASITVHGNFWLGPGPRQIKIVTQPTGSPAAPTTYNQAWGTTITNAINAIDISLNSAGIFQ